MDSNQQYTCFKIKTTANRAQEQYKYYTLLVVVYTILIVTAQAVAYRMLKIGSFIEPGGIFIFPATFVINDVISETYGPQLARRGIYWSLFAQLFYSVIPIFINTLPAPEGWMNQEAFNIVFGSSWLVFISNLVAIFAGMVLNTQLIGKSKLMTSGRFFPLRSFISSAIGEFILTAIIVAIALVPVHGLETGKVLFINMFLFKMVFSLIMLYPAALLVEALKKYDNADVYEENISFNPISIFIKSGKNNIVKLSNKTSRMMG